MPERNLRFVIIGAGMAGIMSGIKLREAGYDDWVVYEKGERVGGTWFYNSYPGLSCDVPSHIYSYAFEPNPEWSHRFSPGPEIREYFEGVARKRNVLERIRFNEEIVRMELSGSRWHIETSAGRRDEADVVIAATGVLHHPMIPEIAGLETFAGARFHSAQWDHSVPLDGKRVGVIGTGSTAIQITGALVPRVARFSLFQRTAQWVAPQDNPAYTDEEKTQLRRDPNALRALSIEMTRAFHENFSNGVVDANSEQMRLLEQTCRDHLESAVKDPVLREKLRPNYRAACKRLIISGEFYPAIQQPNAELVTEAIERIEPRGVRTKDGRLHELDVLVLATGFRVDRFLRPIQVVGRDGVKLDTVWAQRPNAYLSISVPGFPNLYMLNGPNGPVGNFSLITIAEMQLHYILQLVAELRAGRAREVCASEAAMARFSAEFDAAAKNTIWATGCRSWYLDSRGVPAVWPFTYQRFVDEMKGPKLEAYELRA
ncbi:MAG: NAD(P)/FAD-dependent oxidoreductase [Deltaproteobacteria bacterium]|nr:NAD(P)/FAD-dependent oxidoreductase [Deltaproteobacteria bacterium]